MPKVVSTGAKSMQDIGGVQGDIVNLFEGIRGGLVLNRVDPVNPVYDLNTLRKLPCGANKNLSRNTKMLHPLILGGTVDETFVKLL